MTRAQANHLLNAVRRGRYAPEHAILAALRVTGDLTVPIKPRKAGCTFAGTWRTGSRA